jgi:hypothetical protein
MRLLDRSAFLQVAVLIKWFIHFSKIHLKHPIMENNTKNEREYINKYQDKGYTSNYRIQDDQLTNVETKQTYKADDVRIVAEHRFEGMSNPSDMSILYVIEVLDGSKGTVLANYSPASDTAMAEFFNEIPKENVSDKGKITV